VSREGRGMFFFAAREKSEALTVKSFGWSQAKIDDISTHGHALKVNKFIINLKTISSV